MGLRQSFLILLIFSPSFLLSCFEGCGRANEPRAFSFSFEENLLLFEGRDNPSLTRDRSGDRFKVHPKIGHYNDSANLRCIEELQKFESAFQKFVHDASTDCLVKSLRPNCRGKMDYLICQSGNWIIIAELASRRPLKRSLITSRNAGNIFLGSGWVGTQSLSELMEISTNRNSQNL